MTERLGRALDHVGDWSLALGRRSTWMHRWYVPLAASGLTVLAVVAVFRMETSGADYDPQYMRVIVERTIRLGGSYYENGIHNKGPLEPFVYEIAARLGGDDGFWFVLGVFALCAASLVGLAAALFAVRAGGSVAIGASVAAMAIVHLTLSESDYAGVLYARNMTVALLSLGFMAAAFDPAWATARRRGVATAVVGVTAGLAVQTLLTACFTASPILLWAMWTRRHERVWSRPVWLVMPVVSAMALASAPAYYGVTGRWQPFIDGWWVYARFMSTGTGRSLAGQLELGADRFFEYYRDRPVLAAVLIAWIVVTMLRWRGLDADARGLRLLAAAWFVGAWIELILSQRYSSHYFSVLAAPTIMILATLAGEATQRWNASISSRPAAALLPLAAALGATLAGGTEPFGEGVEAAAEVTSTEDFSVRRAEGIDGRTHVVRASLDLVSAEDDPLLMWTSLPWPYLQYERVSATRYIWKTFLLGEIYLGESGPEYVLPGTWERFDRDVDETDPTAFVVESSNPVADGTPFAQRVARDFTPVFVDDALTLSYRNDLARWLQSPMPSAKPMPLGAGSVELGPRGCLRLDGQVTLTDLADQPLRLEFGTATDGAVDASITVDASTGGSVLIESNRIGVAGYVAVDRADGEARISIVVGARAAVLVLDGRIVGAVGVEPGGPVRLVSGAPAFGPGTVISREPPSFTGC